MNSRCIAIWSVVSATLSSWAIPHARAATQYSLTDLGGMFPTDINSAGQIVGNYDSPAVPGFSTRPATLMPGAYTDEPISLGSQSMRFNKSTATSINSFGQVAAYNVGPQG